MSLKIHRDCHYDSPLRDKERQIYLFADSADQDQIAKKARPDLDLHCALFGEIFFPSKKFNLKWNFWVFNIDRKVFIYLTSEGFRQIVPQ